MQDKLRQRQQKSVVASSKRQVLCVPESTWPRIDVKMLGMKQVSVDKKTGERIFSFIKSADYHSLQKEFHAVQATMDIQQLANFLSRNFYHHESLIFIADYLRLQGKFTEAAKFLERCLFAFETAFAYDFQFVPAVDSTSNRHATEEFQPQMRLDFHSKNQEPLNRVLAECLIKYIDILGRKGCNRTALEFCKFLLALDPLADPYGVLLRIDYYAIRAREFEYFIDFTKQLAAETYQETNKIVSVLVLPNLLMTTALA